MNEQTLLPEEVEREDDQPAETEYCGTCGEPIHGVICYNRWGPCHAGCADIAE